MIRKIIQIGDPILDKKCNVVVDIQSTETQNIIIDLLDTVMNVKKGEGAAGLAAPQIGITKSICVCRRVDLEKKNTKIPDDKLWEVLINPMIIKKSKELSSIWEGCLSIGVGNNMLRGPVARPAVVVVKYTDRNGQEQELQGSYIMSHILQHEIDHLNGVLFLSYVHNPEYIYTEKELQKYIKKHKQYPDD